MLAAMAACICVGTAARVQDAHATTVISAAAFGYGYDYGHNHATAVPHVGGIADGRTLNVINVSDYGTGSTESRGLIEFNISFFTDPVASATLNLTREYSNLPSAATISVYGYTSTAYGSIDTSDFYVGTPLGSFTYFNEASVNFDVTSFINSNISLSKNFVGLQLIWTSAAQYAKFVSFNNTVCYPTPCPPPPTLELSAEPIPAALPLFAGGLGVIGLLARRRKRKGAATAA